MSSLGKDITHKMYSLNEQLGHLCTTEALSRVARADHWRSSMNRSVSVDAVNTGTRGHVRSNAWKQAEKCRKSSTHSECEYTGAICWRPIFCRKNYYILNSKSADEVGPVHLCAMSLLLYLRWKNRKLPTEAVNQSNDSLKERQKKNYGVV